MEEVLLRHIRAHKTKCKITAWILSLSVHNESEIGHCVAIDFLRAFCHEFAKFQFKYLAYTAIFS